MLAGQLESLTGINKLKVANISLLPARYRCVLCDCGDVEYVGHFLVRCEDRKYVLRGKFHV